MLPLSLLVLLAGAEPDDGLAKRMLPVYLQEAAAYSLALETAPKVALELKKEPVFEWVNPARNAQQGVAVVWLRGDGRPAAFGGFFSGAHAPTGGRMVRHELHALDPDKLLVSRPGGVNEWKPEGGLARAELPDAPAPATTPAARLLQMRRLAQEFTGHGVDREGKRWEFRLLPAPLYRYPAAKAGVTDGALFAFVSTAGTDPEVLLVIEAKDVNGKLRWEYACGRFSDWELRVERKGKEVWSSVPGPDNPFAHGPLHLYRIYPEKIVAADGKVLARVRQTATGPELLPVVAEPPAKPGAP